MVSITQQVIVITLYKKVFGYFYVFFVLSIFRECRHLLGNTSMLPPTKKSKSNTFRVKKEDQRVSHVVLWQPVSKIP